MKIFVVTSGSYSDYGMRAMFSTRELADEFISKAKQAGEYWTEDSLDVEEWILDHEKDAEQFEVFVEGMMLDDGSVKESHSFQEFGHKFRSCIHQYGAKVPVYHDRPIVRVRSTVSAEHAHKLAVEARQKWLRKEPVLEQVSDEDLF